MIGAIPGGGGHSGASSGSGAGPFAFALAGSAGFFAGGFAGSAGFFAGGFGIALLFGDLLLPLWGFHRGPHSSSSDTSRYIGLLASLSFALLSSPFPLSFFPSSPLGFPLPFFPLSLFFPFFPLLLPLSFPFPCFPLSLDFSSSSFPFPSFLFQVLLAFLFVHSCRFPG